MSDEIDDDSYEEVDLLDKQMEIQAKEESLQKQIDVRRRLERLKEDLELERMLKEDYY